MRLVRSCLSCCFFRKEGDEPVRERHFIFCCHLYTTLRLGFNGGFAARKKLSVFFLGITVFSQSHKQFFRSRNRTNCSTWLNCDKNCSLVFMNHPSTSKRKSRVANFDDIQINIEKLRGRNYFQVVNLFMLGSVEVIIMLIVRSMERIKLGMISFNPIFSDWSRLPNELCWKGKEGGEPVQKKRKLMANGEEMAEKLSRLEESENKGNPEVEAQEAVDEDDDVSEKEEKNDENEEQVGALVLVRRHANHRRFHSFT